MFKDSDKPQKKADNLLGFANNDFRVLITKTSIASFGMNYQNCHNMVFVLMISNLRHSIKLLEDATVLAKRTKLQFIY